MAILVDNETRLVVQGITGREGRFHTGRMVESGTNVVAGVTPGKGGQEYEGVPVFNTMEEAIEETGANASVIFVPAAFCADAIFESLDFNISTVCCITEGVPVHDMMRVTNYLRVKERHPDRAELPRRPLAREGERLHHAARHIYARWRRHRQQERDAYLPDRQRAHAEEHRSIHGGGDRGRPDHRDGLYRDSQKVRGRSRDRVCRDGRGDRG